MQSGGGILNTFFTLWMGGGFPRNGPGRFLIKEQDEWPGWGAWGVVSLTVQFVGLFLFISLLLRRTLFFFFAFLKKLKAFIHDSSHTHTHMHVDLHTCKILIFHLQTGNNINSVNDYPLPLYNIR